MIYSSDILLELFNFAILALFTWTLIIIILHRFCGRVVELKPQFTSIAKNLFPVLLIIILVRTYIFEPFRIPSESMFPLLTTGDVVYVSKTSYDIKFPLTNLSMVNIKEPSRGDVAVFKYPLNMKQYFIKRVIGVPGDRLVWVGDDLFINNVLITREPAISKRNDLVKESYVRYSNEYIDGRKYQIRRLSDDDSTQFNRTSYFVQMRTEALLTQQNLGVNDRHGYLEITIPQGFYFVMGDNRDQSSDSREWGLVSRDNFVGQATYNLLNINPDRDMHFFKKFNFDHHGGL